MSIVYTGLVLVFRVRFAGPVTGTPTAQTYINAIASGSVNGSGASDIWVFTITVPTISEGDSASFEANGVVDGVTQYINLIPVIGVELAEAGGRDWTDEQRDNLIDLFGLDIVPFVPGPVVLPPPENPALSTGYGYVYNNQMVATSGIEVLFQMILGPDSEEQLIQTTPFTVESDEEGLLTVELLRGATYKIWGTDIKRGRVVEVPNEDSFELPEILLW